MSYYLRHVAGFFLQVFPCALLCCLPFGAESLPLARGKLAAVLAAAVLAFSAVFPLVLPVGGAVQNLYMLAAVALLAAAWFWRLRAALVKKLLVLYLALFYAATQYWLVIAMLPLLNGGNFSSQVYSPQCLLLYAATTAVMLPPAGYAFSRVVRDFI